MPTPLAITAAFFDLSSQAIIESQIEEALLRDLSVITATVNQRELAVQWDVAIEFAVLKAGLPVWFTNIEKEIVSRLVRLGESVPTNVDLGYHLCFGDLDHKHFIEPEALSRWSTLANVIADSLTRSIKWFHMPVPKDRDDAAYFAPLQQYACAADLYLGLLHLTDGLEGAERRASAASKYRKEFGIATECGLGRRPSATMPALLQLHEQACKAL